MSEPIMRMNQLSGGQVFRHFHDYMKCGEDSCGICAAIRTCIISIFFPLPQEESGLIPEERVMGNEIERLQKFLTNSKLRFCKNRKCTFNDFYQCAFKEIYLNEKGECMQCKHEVSANENFK